jgi:prepilin-type N-terminal cleavage/methylation domain-containing protein
MKQSMMRPQRSGFTLIELLIVIVLLGVLATVGLNRFWQVRGRAHVSAMQHDLRSLAAQQEAHFSKDYLYASDLSDLPDFTVSEGVEILINYAAADGWGATASHTAADGRQCGLFQPAAPQVAGAPSTQAGTIMCN